MAATHQPLVGIFWRVGVAASSHLLVDAVPCDDAEIYGDFRTHGGHHEYWCALSALTVTELRARHLPEAVKWSEYEEWPRGRVVLHVPTQRFILYADKKLQTTATIVQIMDQFSLPQDRVDVRSDYHYVSVR